MSLIASKPPKSFGTSNVPEEDGAVSTHGRECCVVGRDADVEDFVAVGGVGLDELGGLRRLERVGGGGRRGARGVVQAD